MELPKKETLVKLYRDLLTARRVEEELFSRMPFTHRGLGEEAITVALCNNLTNTDYFHPSFRTAFCYFTKPGVTLKYTLTAILGRARRHDSRTPENGHLGGSATLGEASLRYVGAAVAVTIKKTDDIVVFIQGDGASNRAPTHEAMAVAAAWKLPIIFVIQNNRYAIGTRVENSYNIEDLSLRGVGYGFPHDRVDGNDMIAMYLVAKKHIERCRAGGGPSLIAADTYRLEGHFGYDTQLYRPKGEAEEWWKFEPLRPYTKQLMDLGVLTEEDVDRLEAEVKTEVQEVFEEVEKMPPIRRSLEDVERTAIAEL
jgi:pyruvate dehydrogenase E1 component alpha subunit